MKAYKPTLFSLATWALAASLTIAYDALMVNYKSLRNPLVHNIEITLGLTLVVISTLSMKKVDPKYLLVISRNNILRNIRNSAIMVISVFGAICFLTLFGIFGHIEIGSSLFIVSITGIAASLLAQIFDVIFDRLDG